MTSAVYALIFLWLVSCHAFRHYLELLPNSGRVPCPPGMVCFAEDVPVCGGFGHLNCMDVGVGEGGVNAFGLAFRETRGQADSLHWSDAFCRADSDADGLTNGDELGDPCCTYNVGQQPARTASALISNPGFAVSAHGHASCLLKGPPLPVPMARLLSTNVSRGEIVVAWLLSDVRASCVCAFDIFVQQLVQSATNGLSAYTYTRTFTVRPSRLQPDGEAGWISLPSLAPAGSTRPHYGMLVTICGLGASVLLNVSLVARNLAGASTAVPAPFPLSTPSLSAPVHDLTALFRRAFADTTPPTLFNHSMPFQTPAQSQTIAPLADVSDWDATQCSTFNQLPSEPGQATLPLDAAFPPYQAVIVLIFACTATLHYLHRQRDPESLARRVLLHWRPLRSLLPASSSYQRVRLSVFFWSLGCLNFRIGLSRVLQKFLVCQDP
jgi:hypothetical protein